MTRDLTTCSRDSPLAIPAAKVDAILAGTGARVTFGVVREMFGADVHLRSFKQIKDAKTVVDLGGNRGFFTLLVAKLRTLPKIAPVEPSEKYNDAFAAIADANGLDRAKFLRINTFALRAANSRCSAATRKLSAAAATSRWKCIRASATCELVSFIASTGMFALTTDQHGHIVTPDKALYRCASREGRLQPPFPEEGVAAMSPYAKAN